MPEIASGRVQRKVDIFQSYLEHLGVGIVATDGVVYSAVATFGTTAAEILNQLIDPSVDMGLRELEVGLTQRFTERASLVGSLTYYWEAREEWYDRGGAVPTSRTGSWINISGTYTKGMGTLVNVVDTLSGYVPVASMPHAPVRLRLMAQGLVASSMTGEVKNASYVRLVGIVIPGV